MKRPLIIHPFLSALFPPLFLYAENINEIIFKETLAPAAALLLASAALWLALGLVLKNRVKSAVLASLFFMLFFSFGHVYNLVQGTSLTYVLYALWPAALALGAFFAIRSRGNLYGLTRALNVFALALVAMSAINIAIFVFSERALGEETWRWKNPGAATYNVPPREGVPNIFFIVLDAHARQDVLKEVYGYDNSWFTGWLREKGFFVADQAASNYNQTALALSSTLNLDYLAKLAEGVGAEAQSHLPFRLLAQNNRVFAELRARGYTIVSFYTIPDDANIGSADVYYTKGWSLNTFQNELLNTTPVPHILKPLGLFDKVNVFKFYRKKIHYTMDNLEKTLDLPPPVFVYAHINLPHPPFLFGPDGEEITLEDTMSGYDGDWLIKKGRLTLDQYIRGYRDQLEFTDKKIEEVINGLLAKSKTPPVIVLQGDHGPRSMLVWEDPADTYMKECFGILYAVYLPGGSGELYNGISPVNTFRAVFNRLFGAEYGLLEDRNFFSTEKYPYRFYDVTERVRHPEYEMVHLKFGRAALEEGDAGKAALHFKEALKIRPDSEEARKALEGLPQK